MVNNWKDNGAARKNPHDGRRMPAFSAILTGSFPI